MEYVFIQDNVPNIWRLFGALNEDKPLHKTNQYDDLRATADNELLVLFREKRGGVVQYYQGRGVHRTCNS